MKKEELIEEINEQKKTKRREYFNMPEGRERAIIVSRVNGLLQALELINQLDEPEITEEQAWSKISETFPISAPELKERVTRIVFSNNSIRRDDVLDRLQDIGEHNRNEWIEVILRVFGNDYGTAKYREGYEQGVLNGIMESKKKESVEIPQFVADWIEQCKGWNGSEDTYESDNKVGLITALDTDSAGMLVDVTAWLLIGNNDEVFARAWLDGYTIEKEKMYRVVFPFTGSSEKTLIQRIFTGNTWADDVEDDFEIIAEDHKVEFTEQEIKAIDERYWAFAEEVTE